MYIPNFLQKDHRQFFFVMYTLLYEQVFTNVKGVFMNNKFLLLTERNRHEILDFLPPHNTILDLANFFQNFSDCTRLKILTCLSLSEMCVNDLSALLEINQTTISHQLRSLRIEGLVTFKRTGKLIVYSLQKKAVNDVMLTAVQCL